MNVIQFQRQLSDSQYGRKDRTWFPRWLRRYASDEIRDGDQLIVTLDQVIEFSRSFRGWPDHSWLGAKDTGRFTLSGRGTQSTLNSSSVSSPGGPLHRGSC